MGATRPHHPKTGRGRGLGLVWPRISGDGQVDLEDRPLPHLTLEANVTATLLHDAVDGRKTQPSAFPPWFSGKKRLENMSFRLLVHPRSRITDDDQGIITGVGAIITATRQLVRQGGRRFNQQVAAVGHRITRINHQIHHDLFDLALVGTHQR